MNPLKLIFIAAALTVAVSAKRCPPGNYKIKKDCLPCPRGTFQPKANKYACKPCPEGKIAAKEGSTKCTSCPKYSEPTPSDFKHECVCSDPAVRQSGKCKLCPPGTVFRKGEFEGRPFRNCAECTPGYFQPGVGKPKCLECPRGEYSGFGYTKCIKCAKNENFNRLQGECEKCRSGFYFEEFSGCIPCPRNFFKKKAGRGFCRHCPVGFHSAEGSTKCTRCPKGTVLFNSGKCGRCKAGSYFDRAFHTCKLCFENTFMPYKNIRRRCFSCSDKSFALEGATKCIRCPRNKSLVRDGTCRKCPPGSALTLGCPKCALNSFIRDGMHFCDFCADGTYALPGSTSCFTCPKNQALILKKKGCGKCARGWAYDSFEAKCMKCNKGSVKKEAGIGDCTSCPSGTTSNKARTKCVPK